MRKHGFGWNFSLVASVAAVGGLAFTLASFATPSKNDTAKSTSEAVRENAVANVATDAGQVVFEGGSKPKSGSAVVVDSNRELLGLDPRRVTVGPAVHLPNVGEGGVAGVGTCPNAGGFPGSGEITQNIDVINEVNGVSCGSGASRNQWGRCYNHVAEGATAGQNLLISAVEFNTFSVQAIPPGGVPCLVNIYLLPGVCPATTTGSIPFATADLIASVSQQITADGFHTATFSPAVLVPAGVDFFVEIERPDPGTPPPPVPTGFLATANDGGECDNNYLRCGGLTDWASMAALNDGAFVTTHVMQILSATQQIGGTPAVCGNSIIEAGEDCDPPSSTCSIECQSPGPGIGACCNGISCSVVHSAACTGTYVGDATNCLGAPCEVGACCTNNGQTCTENQTLAQCNIALGTLLPATDCTPNCCPAPAIGNDSCGGIATPPTIAVPGTRTYSGTNVAATPPATCADGTEFGGTCSITTTTACVANGDCPISESCVLPDDPVWWEAFTITSCGNVTIDFCCSSPLFSPVYASIWRPGSAPNGCPCDVGSAGIGADRFTTVFGGTDPPICADNNFHAEWDDLAPGTYYYPIYSDPLDGTIGAYQLHITTTACALGRCCNGGTCTANVDQTTCTTGGGFWGGPNSICFPAAVCSSGACCVDEVCTNGVSAILCTSQGGDLSPGQTCNVCTGGANDGVGCTIDGNCTGGGTCTAQNVFCPPFNDDCGDAEVVVNGTFAVDNVGGTTDGPADGCGDGNQVHNDVWFSYTATCTGDMTLEACGNEPFGSDDTTTDAANFDTVIAVYQGAACPPAAAPLGCDDDGCLIPTVAGGGSVVTVSVVSGTTYLIRVGGFAAANEGQALVNLSVQPAGGACCNTNAGTCTDVAGSGSCLTGQYHDGVCCKDVICNVQNSCDWDNGTFDPFGAGPSSQYAPGEFYSEAADNFILKGSPSNDCPIDGIKFWVSHFGVAAGGCTAGLCRCTNGDVLVVGGTCSDASACVLITEGKCSNDCSFCYTEDPGACGGVPANCIAATCTNSPADYCGVNVTIYQDAFQPAGTTKDQIFDVVPDLAILDCDGLTDPFVSDVRVVVGDPGTILDLDVDLQITHTWVGDLIVDISHFDGATTVTQRLLQRVGDGGDNDATPLCSEGSPGGGGSDTDDVNIVLDDEANLAVDDGPFPLAGAVHYRPNPGSLAAFNGRTKNGTWTLTIRDAFAGDIGTLNVWSLHFTNSGGEAFPKGPSGDPNDDGTHSGVCVGGANDGLPCTNDAACTGGKCGLDVVINVPNSAITFVQLGICDGGVNENDLCTSAANCPGSTCVLGADFEVTLNLSAANVSLVKNKKYWLALSPVVPFTGFYQTGWATSLKFDGNPAQQIFDLVGLTDWTVVGEGDSDLAFQIAGTKPVTGCSCVTAADCRNTLCAQDNACNCATCSAGVCVFSCTAFGNVNSCTGGVTLDDILCDLAGFGSFAACPNGDIDPCGGNGIINLDDILKVLAAFGGANPCGCLPGGTPDLCGSSSP